MIKRMAMILLMTLAPFAARAQSCTIANSSVNFGTYTGSTTSVVGSLSVTCTAGLSWTIAMTYGLYSGGQASWNMVGPNNDLLPYAVYLDSAHTQPISNSQFGNAINGVGTGAPQTVFFYPQVPAHSGEVPGNYSDTITPVIFYASSGALGSIAVSASVPAACSLSASAMTFGVYSGTQKDAAAIVSITCTSTTTFIIGVNTGQYSQAANTSDMIGPGGALLAYRLFQDSGRSTAWGADPGVNTPGGTGTGSVQTIPIYGRIPAGQYVTPGAYSDIVSLVLVY